MSAATCGPPPLKSGSKNALFRPRQRCRLAIRSASFGGLRLEPHVGTDRLAGVVTVDFVAAETAVMADQFVALENLGPNAEFGFTPSSTTL